MLLSQGIRLTSWLSGVIFSNCQDILLLRKTTGLPRLLVQPRNDDGALYPSLRAKRGNRGKQALLRCLIMIWGVMFFALSLSHAMAADMPEEQQIELGTIENSVSRSSEIVDLPQQLRSQLLPADEQRIVTFLEKLGRSADRDKSGNFLGLGGLSAKHHESLCLILKEEQFLPRTLWKWQTFSNLPANIASALISLFPCSKKIKNDSRMFWPCNESGWIADPATRRAIYGSRAFADGIFSSISLAKKGAFWGFAIYQVIYASPFTLGSLFEIVDGKQQSGIRSLVHFLTDYPAAAYGITSTILIIPTLSGAWKAFSAKAVTDDNLKKSITRIGKSTKKNRGYGDKFCRDVAAPLFGLPISPLNPTNNSVNTIIQLLNWDNNFDDPAKRSQAFLAVQNLFERGSLLSLFIATKALSNIASGVSTREYPSYASEEDLKNDFAIKDLAIRIRAFEELWNRGNKSPLAVLRGSEGPIDGASQAVVWLYINYQLWNIGHSPSKVLSGVFLTYNLGIQVTGWIILRNLLSAWIEYKNCPNRSFSFKTGGYAPSSLDYSEGCFLNGFVEPYNQLPGQPGHTLTDAIAKFNFPTGEIALDLTSNCAKTPITADNIAAILLGIKNKPGLKVTSLDISGCDLSDSNGVNGTAALGGALALFPEIQSVRMSGCNIEQLSPAAELLASFGILTVLNTLDLSNNHIIFSGSSKALGDNLPPSVTDLDVSKNRMGSDVSYFISGMCNLRRLIRLNMMDAAVGLSPHLQGIECLKFLPLQVLRCNRAAYTNDTIALGNALSPSLIELDIDGLASDALVNFMGNIPQALRILSVKGVNLESPGDGNGTLALAQNFPTALEEFDGSYTNLGLVSNGTALFAAFPSTLKTIKIAGNRISQIDQLIPIITSGNLQRLDLRSCYLQDPVQIDLLMQAIAQALAYQPSFSVDLSYNNIGQTPLDNSTLLMMGQVFSNTNMTLFPQRSTIPADQLEVLCLNINNGRASDQYFIASPYTVDHFFSILPSNLTSLSLSGMLLNADAATLRHLMLLLLSMNITHLDLSGNLFDADVSRTQAIADIGFPPNLQYLNFGGNLYNGQPAQNMTASWGQLRFLETLVLAGNRFTPSDAQTLKYTLMSLPNLKTLDLTRCILGPGSITQGIIEIAESFDRQKNPTTQFNPTTLLLGSTNIGSDSYNNNNDTIALADALSQTQLQVLDVSAHNFPNEIHPELMAALPQSLVEFTAS
ncbi:MAG: hypothetical protein WCG04_01620, partial [Alphaproteobacteria bacterium]